MTGLQIASMPVRELSEISSKPVVLDNIALSKDLRLSEKVKELSFPCLIRLTINEAKDLSIRLSNDLNEELLIGFDKKENKFYIDRTRSGKTDFHKEFAARHSAPRFTGNTQMNITLIIDVSSVELFADDGLTVMTEIFFPTSPFKHINFQSVEAMSINKLVYTRLKSIWK